MYWRLYPETTPEPSYDWDYSKDRAVLVTTGNSLTIATLHTFSDPESDPVWIAAGPDGYTVRGVTHWMPLPALPLKPSG